MMHLNFFLQIAKLAIGIKASMFLWLSFVPLDVVGVFLSSASVEALKKEGAENVELSTEIQPPIITERNAE